MKLAQNQALKIFITSIIILFICIFAVHSFNVKSITDRHIQLSRSIADESSKIIENQLLEKVKSRPNNEIQIKNHFIFFKYLL